MSLTATNAAMGIWLIKVILENHHDQNKLKPAMKVRQATYGHTDFLH